MGFRKEGVGNVWWLESATYISNPKDVDGFVCVS
jgi:hypothetical protein